MRKDLPAIIVRAMSASIKGQKRKLKVGFELSEEFSGAS